jgi:16S rRNA (guanine527-N7)-methyltransferase
MAGQTLEFRRDRAAMNESHRMDLIGLRVSRETSERLDAFAALFMKWAKAINLVAPSTVGDLRRRHIADSSQVIALSPSPATWVDLGSGAGFPGIITAIFLAEMKEGWVHLIESNNKKASFLRSAILETGARASVHPTRIEAAPSEIQTCERISARALADLNVLLRYSSPWLGNSKGAKAYFHKGRDYERELVDARSEWDFDLVKHKGQIEADSVILEVFNLRKKSQQ